MKPWHEEELEEVRRHRHSHLNLSYGELDSVPAAVRKLHWVESLNISGNRIRDLPSWLSELKALREVVAFDNPIEDWPAGLPISAHWSVIERLGVPDEQVRGVALNWELESPPERFLALSKLRRLDLQELELSGNPITRLPEPIVQLTRLQTLEADDAGLSCLPGWLFALFDLRSLSVDYNGISELPSAIRQSVRLVTLRLSNNPLEFIPDELAALQRLEHLDLSNTNLQEIPTAVYSLHRLRSLLLQYTLHSGAYFARGEAEIVGINRTPGQIREIPAAILKLTHLSYLDISGQPIVTPPEEVVFKGLDAIRDYWRQRAETGTDYLCEAKLLIVGEGGAGKSTLAAKILDPTYVLDPDRPSTEGIDILRWRFPSRIHPRADGAAPIDRDFEVGIWDFGGQEIYHVTHQFFLTRRSLYVLVADARKEDTDFHYWLGVVELLVGDAPLIIVKNEKQDRRRELDEATLRARFPNVKEILATNLQTNRGLDEVIRRIRHHLEGSRTSETHCPPPGSGCARHWSRTPGTISP
jgi:internalin A